MENSPEQGFLKVLGFEPADQPDAEKLKKSWRDLCQEHHPDKGGDSKKFLEVMHAYKMLTDISYRHQEAKREKSGKDSLDIALQVPISFIDAFFGKDLNVSWNQVEISDDLEPIIQEKYKVKAIKITIPPGSSGGFRHVEESGGLICGDKEGRTLINVMPTPHKTFSVKGDDVLTKRPLDIPLETFLKGGEIEVLTLYGLKTVHIPPGTRPDDEFSIPNCGVLGQGAHLIKVQPVYPTQDDLKTKDTWKDLGINWAEEEKLAQEDHKLEEAFIRLGPHIYTTRGAYGRPQENR